MLTPAAPNAGPTGGEGFAAPPLTCSFRTFSISFAIILIKLNTILVEAKSYFYYVTFIFFQLAYNLTQEEFYDQIF